MAIQEETQTVATITYQNYFRRYDKLAGMTGTALTEATEFMKIYDLQVVEIPTNRPMIRNDRTTRSTRPRTASGPPGRGDRGSQPDRPAGAGRHDLGGGLRAALERAQKRGIKHTVLNAKPEHAEREGETIAEAGRPFAVTIATNMAGRGVDIKLGGNEEHLTQRELVEARVEPGSDDWDKAWDEVFPQIEQQVAEDREKVRRGRPVHLRHRAARVAPDRQPAARPLGRQGDPGESRFYLSAEDDLVRLFAGDRIYRILDNKFLAQADDDGNELPIEHKMLSKQIENAQKKVEEQNFLIRKRVLEYDDVMNQQREIVYEYRDRILEGQDMSEIARTQIAEAIERLCASTSRATTRRTGSSRRCSTSSSRCTRCPTTPTTSRRARPRSTLVEKLREDVVEAYDDREEELGSELMRALERFMLLQIIDERWREHLHDMDYLREGIHLRGFAQIDPLVAYKNEGFEMFTELMNNIWDEFARYVFNVEVEVAAARQPPSAAQRPGGGDARRNGRARARRRGRGAPRRRARCRPPRRPATVVPAGAEAAEFAEDEVEAAARGRAQASTSTRRSAAMTRAGAARARSSRSAMAHDSDASGLRDQLKLLADYL